VATDGGSDRRTDLLAAAAALFRARGYQGTSMDDIAKAVGLNKGTLYHYIPSKAGILFEIYRTAQETALARIRSIPLDMPVEEAVAEIIRMHLRSIDERPAETAVYFQEMRWIEEWLTAEQIAILRTNERAYLERATEFVQRGIDTGRFAPTDAATVGAGFVGLAAWTYQWFDPTGPHTVDDVAEVFIPMVLHGLAGERLSEPVA